MEDREHEGGSPRSPRSVAPELDRNPGYLAPSLAVWSEPFRLADTHKKLQLLPHPTIFEEPGTPNQELAQIENKSSTPFLDRGAVWVGMCGC